MFAELMGKVTGTGGGMGGSMHIADFERGVYGANGIVGAGLPIGVGVADGFRQQGRDDVVVVFFGDGAIAQGAFHESLKLAALWRLPVLFLCENNQYAEFSATQMQHPVPVASAQPRTGWMLHRLTATMCSPSPTPWAMSSSACALGAAGHSCWRQSLIADGVTSRVTPSSTGQRQNSQTG
ncbi:MAG: 2-oxoisovalerate dehydrogenase component [Mycobacterium sp.]|nr:2-oxoisovalerate dehydrogenase component [Mycobacterium sp.]